MFDREQVRASTLRMATLLGRKIGGHKVIDDPDLLHAAGGDESYLDPIPPDLLVRARSADDVVAVLELAEQHGVPVVARGGGTGKAGGAIPMMGGVVIDVTRMNRIAEIDKANLLAVVEPGIITGELHKAAETERLFYPPDPNSLENCTLGGNVAHNAGGPRALKYGVTREYVLGLEVVLMGGRRLKLGRRTVKGVAGYDLTALMVGSEGTLGIFTEVTVRLVANPTEISTLLVRFSNEIDAGRAVSRIVEVGIVPRVMEFMDGMMVETLRISGAKGVPAGTGALLLVEIDGSNEQAVEADVLKTADICEKEGAIEVLMAKSFSERNELWSARRNLSDAVRKRASHKIAEDIVVPRSKAAELLEQLKRLGEKRGVTIASYGHAGDGNFHVNLLWDDPEWDPEQCLDDLFRLVLDLGGSITGEHGIGLAKKRYLPWEKSEKEISVYKEIKRIFDPKGLMNPGKIF